MKNITKVVFEGQYKKLKVGINIDLFEDEKHLISQYYKNGRSVGCRLFYDGLVFDIGNDENGLIVYWILKFHNQSDKLIVEIDDKKILLEATTLKEFLKHLNDKQIDWQFGTCWDKLIRVNVNNVSDVIFAFYPEDEGCQVVEITDKDKFEIMKNSKFYDKVS
ncbi:MAG: hypothetical protein AB8B69_09715 [Chitinophagales bacterium]